MNPSRGFRGSTVSSDLCYPVIRGKCPVFTASAVGQVLYCYQTHASRALVPFRNKERTAID